MNKTPILFKLVLLIYVLALIVNKANAQNFKGFNAFKQLIEYEGQRYLMKEIHEITSENYDNLKIDKIIKEVDTAEGFMLVITSYVFNGRNGIVITSFNSTSFNDINYQFTNLHLTDKEYLNLYNTCISLGKENIAKNEHLLKKISNRLTVDINNVDGFIFYTLWVDTNNRHTFSKSKWEKAYKKHQKFIGK